MPIAGCPTEHELLERSGALSGERERAERDESGERDASGEREQAGAAREPDEFEAHLAACSECRIIVSALARASRPDSGERTRPPQSGGSQDSAVTADASESRETARPRVVRGDLIDGKYRVDDMIGSGGMGLVLGATHDVLGSRVAIKVPSLAVRDDPEVRARLLREARMVARLEGEYVGRVLDAGLLPGGFPFVVFELLSGRTLAERLHDDGRLALGDAIDVILEACAGLFEAHAAGIVHRDVKPSNLFEARRADGTTTVRVIDFGIAKTYAGTDTLTRSRVVLGTPAYMAPEQTAAAEIVDARADVWALGMTLVELLTGRTPTVASFAARMDGDGGSLVGAITGAGASRRDAMTIARVVGRCLRERPDERFASVDALAAELAPFAGERGRAALASIARRGGHVGVVSARPAPRRAGLVMASVAILIAIALGAWAIGRSAPVSSNAPLASAAPPAATPTPSSSADPTPIVAAAPTAVLLPVSSEAPAVQAHPAPAATAGTTPAHHVPRPVVTAIAPPPPEPSVPRDVNGLGDRK